MAAHVATAIVAVSRCNAAIGHDCTLSAVIEHRLFGHVIELYRKQYRLVPRMTESRTGHYSHLTWWRG